MAWYDPTTWFNSRPTADELNREYYNYVYENKSGSRLSRAAQERYNNWLARVRNEIAKEEASPRKSASNAPAGLGLSQQPKSVDEQRLEAMERAQKIYNERVGKLSRY